MIIPDCHRIVGGMGEGPALVTTQMINFLAMVDTRKGIITEEKHELYGKSMKGTVLVFPHAVGSSVGAYAIYSLKQYGNAPSAMICTKSDITTASGCAIAGIPLVDLPLGTEITAVYQGAFTKVDCTNESAIVKI